MTKEDSRIINLPLRYLQLGRTLLLGLLLLVLVVLPFVSQIGYSGLQWPIWGVSGLLVLSLINYWLPVKENQQLDFEVLAGSVLVTMAVYLTGGALSPFLFLYLICVMIIALAASRAWALLTVVSCGVSYALLVAGLQTGVLQLLSEESAFTLPLSALVLQMIGLNSAMILVAVLTSFLSGKLRISSRKAAISDHNFKQIENEQRALLKEVPVGVITTDKVGKIRTVNTVALQLIGFREENEAIGRDLAACLARVNITIGDIISKTVCNYSGETIINNRDEERQILSYCVKDIINSDGSGQGYVAILTDQSRLRDVEGKLALHDRMLTLIQKSQNIANESYEETCFCNLIGSSEVMRKVFSLINRVAANEATVLISGESGTGKELVAQAIHRNSSRKDRPFVAINCGAIPEALLESELFGHKRGSFTGSVADRLGVFREADGGTLFLDEIGELPLNMQVKLLRALQQKVVRPVGENKEFAFNVRIVAATNKNLRRLVEGNLFREDLFYRINVIAISLPPLRDRQEDIPLLMRHILMKIRDGVGVPVVAPESMALLLKYDYPGNVRELENILERAVVLGGEIILPDHLPEQLREPAVVAKQTEIVIDNSISFPVDLESVLNMIESKYLQAALKETSGAKKKAAQLLGINFRSFRYRLQKANLIGAQEIESDGDL